MILPRGLEHNHIRLLKDGKDVTIEESDSFFDQFPSREVIRIPSDEYDALPAEGLFTHFNLQTSHHKVGTMYLLPKILAPGYFDGKNEVLPLLRFEHVPYGKCVEVQEEIQYEELTEKDFEYSFSHIKSIDQLREAIVKRYSRSLPHLPEAEILGLGVSKTTLKIIGKM